ncbi:hypothetical protein Tco_0984456 [Tanacetum coccineum]
MNGEAKIHALVDGKKVIIFEATVRMELQLADEEGVDCLPNSTIFKELTRMGYEKVSQKLTFYKVPQPSEPSHVADGAVNEEMDDRLVRAATTASSLEAEQDSGNINKTRSKATPNEPGSQRTSSCGGPRCEETVGGTSAQTRFERVSKQSNDPLLAGVNTPRSGEDSLKLE